MDEEKSSLDFDWDKYESVFVVDPKYEGIQAPMWMDFLRGRDQPFHDDDEFFCKPDCIHPKTATSLINSPSFQSPRVNQPRTITPLRISNTTPLGDRTASTLNCKKPRALVASSLNSLYELRATENASNPHMKRRGAPLSNSVITLNELKAKENASQNIKKSSTMDRNKYDWKISKYFADAENDNPNSPRGVSGAASIVRNPKSQSMKYTVNSHAKVSKQSIAARELQSPLSIEKKGVSKQACRTASRTPSTDNPSVTGEKKGVVRQSNHRVTSGTSRTVSPLGNTERREMRGSMKQLSYSTNTEVTTPTRSDRHTTNRIPTNDHKSSPALKPSFSPSVLFSKSSSRDFLSQLSGLYSDLKNVWNTGGQKDSAEQSDNPVEHYSNADNDENVNSHEIDSYFLSEYKYERCSPSGYDDPDKSSKSGPLKITNALQQRGNKNAGKIFSKSVDCKTFNVGKNGDPVRTRDTMTSTWLSTLHMHEDEEEESLGDDEIVLMEPLKKSSQSKIFSPSTWKNRRNDDGDKKVAHSSKKHNLKTDRAVKKVQSSPPSPQKLSRSSSLTKKATTQMQPFRLRTSERSTAREFRKLQRSNTCGENTLTSSESRINVPDMFWLFKRCAYMN